MPFQIRLKQPTGLKSDRTAIEYIIKKTMRTIDREIVSVHVYSRDGKLLMARNTHPAAGTVYGDCWKIPGGGVESGETQQQALIREVQEETGINISSLPVELIEDSMKGEAEKTLRETGEKVLAKM